MLRCGFKKYGILGSNKKNKMFIQIKELYENLEKLIGIDNIEFTEDEAIVIRNVLPYKISIVESEDLYMLSYDNKAMFEEEKNPQLIYDWIKLSKKINSSRG